jgi:tetratricopeptide (TPR) repeat protein
MRRGSIAWERTTRTRSLTDSDANGSAELATQLQYVSERLRRRDFAAACEAASALRAHYPADRDVLYALAVSLRCGARIPEALEVLQDLERYHPAFGSLFEERGFCQLAQGATEPAIAAFSKALRLNPWLPVSLKALQELYRRCGRLKEAAAAARLATDLDRLPKAIATAHRLFADGEARAAERLVRQYLLTHGDDVAAMRLLARIAMAADPATGPENHEPEMLLEKALQLAPDHHLARYEYAEALSRRLQHRRAREQLEKLLAVDPEDRAYRLAHARACAALGEHERALATYQKLLSEVPGLAGLHLDVGFTLKSLGRTAEAINSFRAAAALRPADGSPWWNLANLKTYRFEDAELEQMARHEADPATTLVDRYQFCFALGKALEDRGDYARSFQYYERGNQLKKQESKYRPEDCETYARMQVAVCTREFFAARRGWGCPDAAPIFIVGLPRAGSTLIEQILASHSQVEGTMELPTIFQLLNRLEQRARMGGGAGYPAVLAELTREDCARLGAEYLRETLAYRRGKPFFTDKWSTNFRDLGFIHLILPNARIIDARREAIACAFSNFKQLFSVDSGPQFVYSFEDIARYYRMYVQLMRHWDAVLPGKILRIEHEELVTDFPANARRLLDFCQLEPETACFEFHKTERAVISSSSEQVRQPLNRAGLDQWRHFEPYLGPLKEALAPQSSWGAPAVPLRS